MDVLFAKVSLVNVLVLDNLCEYRHKSFIKLDSLGYILVQTL